MKLLCLSLLSLTFLFPSLKSEQVNVILIGGQSNTTGQGRVSNLPASFKANPKVRIFYSRYLNSGKGGEVWKPLCPASESPDRFGVELSLGTSLQKQFPGKKIALIKHGLSGSNLYSQWNPGKTAADQKGPEYQKFLQTVNKGLDELKKQGDTPVIRGMVWQQGEADARDTAGITNSRAYESNLKHFIQRVREDLHSETMPFVYGTVMPMKAERFTGREIVKQAQRNVSETSGKTAATPGAILVEADDLQMLHSDYNTPSPKDDVHLGTFGLLNLGERFAKALAPYFKEK